jgi:hypothetical protein
MANHKFTYTVSGVDLSQEQQAAVSRAIAAAVTTALVGTSPKALVSDALSYWKIHGGIWIDPAALSRTTADELQKLSGV